MWSRYSSPNFSVNRLSSIGVQDSEHPKTALALQNYADLPRETNGNADAATMEARTLAIRTKHAEPNPPK